MNGERSFGGGESFACCRACVPVKPDVLSALALSVAMRCSASSHSCGGSKFRNVPKNPKQPMPVFVENKSVLCHAATIARRRDDVKASLIPLIATRIVLPFSTKKVTV